MSTDNKLTLAAIAVLAMCVATTAHEAIGHGAACLLSGGQITKLTSVYFDCSAHNVWVPAGGPLGNLGAALAGLILLRLTPLGRPGWRLLFAAIFTMSLFWFAGYLLYSAVTGGGDNAIVARILFGAPDWRWQVGLFLAGLVFYHFGINAVDYAFRPFAESRERSRGTVLTTYFAAALSAILAASLYAPDRQASAIQGALEIGAATLPLLPMAFRMKLRTGPYETGIAANPFWIAAAAILFTAFAWTLGRGLP